MPPALGPGAVSAEPSEGPGTAGLIGAEGTGCREGRAGGYRERRGGGSRQRTISDRRESEGLRRRAEVALNRPESPWIIHRELDPGNKGLTGGSVVSVMRLAARVWRAFDSI